MSPGGSQASAGEGLSPCNIGIGIGNTPYLAGSQLVSSLITAYTWLLLNAMLAASFAVF